MTAPSPFARKCRIIAREKGLIDRVEEIFVDPYANTPELVAANPIAQAPCLIAEDGEPIINSPLICEYLDEIGSGARLVPDNATDRLRVRRLDALANAALEMGVKLVLEKRRPEAERSPSWTRRWTENMARALDALEIALPEGDDLDMGVITASVAATWIGFRHPDFDWRTGRPRLVALRDRLEARPSFVETFPA
ncbi:glutathione S-transferase N-terminal domain-containing protein [Brevundimonas sp. NPDC092305]|uniref:glutathione S-transferase N-terminal domain-containing protein n=1 Tax=Brevundimonas sp. NPDC092305 TaxID=3363957 RepID=UPI0038248836